MLVFPLQVFFVRLIQLALVDENQINAWHDYIRILKSPIGKQYQVCSDRRASD